MTNATITFYIALIALFFTASTHADIPYDYNYFTLQNYEITLVSEGPLADEELQYLPFIYDGSCTGKGSKKPPVVDKPGQGQTPPIIGPGLPIPGKPILPGPIIPGRSPYPVIGNNPLLPPIAGNSFTGVVGGITQIINIGKMIWDIIKANQPVTNITTERAFAMPAGINCWTQLEYWSRPKAKTYNVAYKNLYGSKVAAFELKLIYYHGGRFKGMGRYLANVTVVPSKIKVNWGFKLSANVLTEAPVNLASQEDPIAGIGIGVTWQVESMLTDRVQTLDLFVDGNGNVDLL